MKHYPLLLLAGLSATVAPLPASANAHNELPCPPALASKYWNNRVSGLRSALRISKEQEPAFNSFISAALKTSSEVALEVTKVYSDAPGNSDTEKTNRELRVRQYLDQQKATGIAPAYSMLAAALSQEQKDTADRNFSWWVPDLLSTSAGECLPDPVTGFTPLMFAAASGDVIRAESLIRSGASVDAANNDGRTALIFAAMFAGPNASTVAKMLVSNHANVDAADHDGQTALLAAAGNEDPTLVAILLAAGADVNHRLSQGDTALFGATGTANLAVVHLLLAKGADPNAADRTGMTPIMLAAQCADSGSCDPDVDAAHYLEVAEALVAAGADPKVKDQSGKSALDYIRSGSSNPVLIRLRVLLSR